MPWNEDMAVELDALQAMYSDELKIQEPKGVVSMLLAPSDSSQEAYVQCQLELAVHDQYPEQAPGISLQEARGLGSTRLAALQAELQREASVMLGEMMLGQLFECAKDWLSRNNCPEGPCIFCLEELAPNSSSSSNTAGQEQPYMRLPCFHAFHQSCFADWWCWQQQDLAEQQLQLEQRTGATAAAALVQEQLPAKDGEYFLLACPSCRAAFSVQQDLQHMRQQLQLQLLHSGGQSSHSSSSAAARLSAAQLAPFKHIQQRHAALFAGQQQRNAIITDTNYSIADWDPVVEAAVAAERFCSSSFAGRIDETGTSSSSNHAAASGAGKHQRGQQAVLSGRTSLPAGCSRLPAVSAGVQAAAGRGGCSSESNSSGTAARDVRRDRGRGSRGGYYRSDSGRGGRSGSSSGRSGSGSSRGRSQRQMATPRPQPAPVPAGQ